MKKAFTLIEVLVVVLIIGILSAVALPQYQRAVMRARLAQAFVIFDTYRKGIELWLLENGVPTSSTRIYFTGTQQSTSYTYGQLSIDMPTTAGSNINTFVDNILISAECKDTRCAISMRGYDGKWLDDCGFQMNNYYNGKWVLYGILKSAMSTLATTSQCQDFTKAVCLWVQSQGMEARPDAKAQCTAQGVNVTEYSS